ncbi:hypothetical protein [Mesonia sp. K7]|uniref:hypothetical protein n=1 Tax=Mesonia sp. K7 TaxID=2218606 RepID=UPI000DA9C0A7|nr:hypothetical protein [Mesonia sp. K7]PZD79085.1 hypothetical protein DNG35_03510 [Mesonia sp. K7]
MKTNRLYSSILLFFVYFSSFSQEKAINEEHLLIDNFFKETETELYTEFVDFKGIKIFIDQPNIFENLYGQPCIEKNEKVSFERFFTKKEIDGIVDKISNFKTGENIIQTQLKNVQLSSDIEHKNLVFITKPILVNNKAILYLKRRNEESILIFKKDINESWQVICQKFLYLSIED